LRSRLYSTVSAAPTFTAVFTRSRTNPNGLRFPCVESIFNHFGLQPYIHDIEVELKHGRRTSIFRAFFKRHVRLPPNPTVAIKGDLLLMRVGSRNENLVVNLRKGDRQLADYIAKQ
ncbi:hypothetical protein B0H15DRAFT_781268, partial [Mycena belliarum]